MTNKKFTKTDTGVRASVIYSEAKVILKIPDFCSVFIAEILAISFALKIIK